MAPSFEIRRAERSDAPSIVDFNLAMASETEDRALDPATLRSGVDAVFDDETRGFYVVVESGGRVAGALLVTYEWSEWRGAPFWWIQSVYVAPEFRSRGAYRAMHDRVAEWARDDGACGLRLYVEKHNAKARRVYEFLGMHETPYDLLEIEF
jgi:GNAT superfamily N-acetyltransferase